jgi:DNA-binding HxlR family transcriptional regulator
VARTLDVVGERWTLLVLRDAFQGKRRFEEFTRSLPVARNILSDRLRVLVEHGVLERTAYQQRPTRYEYRLTPKGFELYPVIVALLQWGDRYLAGSEGPPLDLLHKDCGGQISAHTACSCGATVSARDARSVYRLRSYRSAALDPSDEATVDD